MEKSNDDDEALENLCYERNRAEVLATCVTIAMEVIKRIYNFTNKYVVSSRTG